MPEPVVEPSPPLPAARFGAPDEPHEASYLAAPATMTLATDGGTPMTDETWVALLHSVVLGPGRRVGMEPLRAMAAELGLAEPRTLVATGNVVFRGAGPTAALEDRLEAAFAARFGRVVDIIVRDAAGWRRLVAANPFAAAAEAAPATVHVRVMRDALGPEAAAALQRFAVAGERAVVAGGDLWLHLPHGAGRSALGAAATPKRLGVGTVRNWNTARRLGAMLDD